MNVSAAVGRGVRGRAGNGLFSWIKNIGLLILGSVCALNIKIPTFSEVFMHGI